MPRGNLPYGVQYDEQGRPFLWTDDGRKNYISPVAFGGQRPEDTTGIFRQRPQWNQQTGGWETPIDWGNILSLATGAGLGAGVGSAAGLFGGAGAGAGAPAASAAEGSLVSPFTGLPGAISQAELAGMGPAAAGATAAGTSESLLSKIGGGGNRDWLGGLIAAGAGLGTRALTGGFHDTEMQTPPELAELLTMALDRMRQQEPLFKAVTNQAYRGLPTYAREG